MKRLTILCVAIVIALVIAVVASNQSASARLYQPFQQDPFGEEPIGKDPFGEDPETQASTTQGTETQGTETQASTTQGTESNGSATPMTETKTSFTQSSETQGSSQSVGSGFDPVPFEKKFWRYLSANNYKNWAPIPGKTGDFTLGQRPHGNLIKMYLNRTAAGNTATLPVGSIIVKENYGDDESLQAITVMYKNVGYNPGSGDWYWVKYNPDGSVPFSPPEAGSMKLAGRVKACIECHAGAGGDDFAFFND